MPNIYAGVAGLSLIEEAGAAAIEAHVGALSDELIAGLDALGATVVTPRDAAARGPLVCVASGEVDTLVGALAAEAVVVSSRRPATCASPSTSTTHGTTSTPFSPRLRVTGISSSSPKHRLAPSGRGAEMR